MEIAIAAALIVALCVANAMATRVVVRDELSERHQKVFQLLAVWLVPVFGAIFVFALHRKPEEPSRKYREAPDPGEDFGSSRQVGRSIQSVSDD
jgi:hypothetical protein